MIKMIILMVVVGLIVSRLLSGDLIPYLQATAIVGFLVAFLIWLHHASLLPEGSMVDRRLAQLTNWDELKSSLDQMERTSETIDLQAARESMKNQVKGQDHIIDALLATIRNGMMLKSATRPTVSVLISGPSGTGKTKIGEALAKALEWELLVIPVNELGSHGLSSWVGSPAGYKDSEKPGKLVEFLKANKGRGILLFDELEKVQGPFEQSEVARLLMTVLDKGIITSARGEQVSARQTAIICTSNAKADELGREAVRLLQDNLEPDALRKDLNRKAKAILDKQPFMTELLNRFTLITTTLPLSTENQAALLAQLIEEDAESYGHVEIVQIESDVILHGVSFIRADKSGGRSLRDWVHEHLGESMYETGHYASQTRRDKVRIRLVWLESDARIGWEAVEDDRI